jgi:serine/threonine-protein kinase RsbT
MAVLRHETMPVRSDEDCLLVRQLVRRWAAEQGFSLVEQTKVVTAASEIARNTVIYGGGGNLRLEALNDGDRKGLRLTFEDKGPGIRDIEQALKDGFTTGNGLGLGLGGAKRLSSEFEIHSQVGSGTTVRLVRWK